MEQYLVKLRQATVKYHKHIVLDKVDLTMHYNEWRACIGCNGSGKTTLLKVITGLVRLHSGDIIAPHIQRIAYIPQDVSKFIPPLTTVEELLIRTCDLYSACNSWSITNKKNACYQVLLDTKSDHLLHKPFKQLSFGQQKSVQVAQCLLNRDFDLLILDEPFNGIDCERRQAIMDTLTIHRQHKYFSLLMVSHDLLHIRQYFDTVSHIRSASIYTCQQNEHIMC